MRSPWSSMHTQHGAAGTSAQQQQRSMRPTSLPLFLRCAVPVCLPTVMRSCSRACPTLCGCRASWLVGISCTAAGQAGTRSPQHRPPLFTRTATQNTHAVIVAVAGGVVLAFSKQQTYLLGERICLGAGVDPFVRKQTVGQAAVPLAPAQPPTDKASMLLVCCCVCFPVLPARWPLQRTCRR